MGDCEWGFFENTYGSDITSGIGLLQPDGKVLVSGSFFTDKNGFLYSVGLLRYNDETKKQIIVQKIKHYIQTHNNVQATTLNSVSIYPNPAQNILHVQGLSSTKAKLTVVDFAGDVAFKRFLSPPGPFFVCSFIQPQHCILTCR